MLSRAQWRPHDPKITKKAKRKKKNKNLVHFNNQNGLLKQSF